MANESKKILAGERVSEDQFVKTEANRIDVNNPSLDEDRGVKLNNEGYIDGEFGGFVSPVKIEKVDDETEKQYFSADPNDYFLIRYLDEKVEVYDSGNNLLYEILINDEVISIN